MNGSDDIATLLSRAAELAASQGVSVDAFMTAAWQAFVEKDAQMLEQLELMHLAGHLHLLRMHRRVASA